MTLELFWRDLDAPFVVGSRHEPELLWTDSGSEAGFGMPSRNLTIPLAAYERQQEPSLSYGHLGRNVNEAEVTFVLRFEDCDHLSGTKNGPVKGTYEPVLRPAV